MSRKDIENIKKVKEFRKKGITFRQIAKLLERDLKTIWRWSKYETEGEPVKKTCIGNAGCRHPHSSAGSNSCE